MKAVFEPFGALDAIEVSRDGNGQSNGHDAAISRVVARHARGVSIERVRTRWPGFKIQSLRDKAVGKMTTIETTIEMAPRRRGRQDDRGWSNGRYGDVREDGCCEKSRFDA